MARKRNKKLMKTLTVFSTLIVIAGVYLLLVKTIDNLDGHDTSSDTASVSKTNLPATDVHSVSTQDTSSAVTTAVVTDITDITDITDVTETTDITYATQPLPEQTEPVVIVEPVLPVVPSGSSEIDNEWAFILINADNPLPDDYSFTTKPVYSDGEREYSLDERCYEYAVKMLADARLAGYELNVISAYRSVEQQQYNIEASINNLMNQGYSYEEAEKYTMMEIQYPGCSEHNAGLALDILTSDWWWYHTTINSAFEDTPEFDWLYANSWKYGFVLRYPKDKEDITKISYEPWHYRFIGLYHAQKMVETGLCLEEYFNSR